ncbi:MAG: bifunctional 5,10-methylenetetrahydrofolate dehydrogenase/5,10-methenyltetrahydrofolate cyclohydrolase [Gammaproteobacteria bacterium]|nr:bifunctional 5,10-methylenetetrahydrofolate dehydrogenase/5,10-methenyltetrahydrofolate cyclohydrolase [Gammaproteobacteria bacterium]
MMYIDGKACASALLGQLKPLVSRFEASYNRKPTLRIIRINDDYASKIYTEKKIKVAHSIGIDAEIIILPDNISCRDAIVVVKQYDNDQSVDGIIIQLPLPKQISKDLLLNEISPHKDVDGISAYSLGALVNGSSALVPCTPQGIIRLTNYIQLDVRGLDVVILGQSIIVGRPVALAFLNLGATVTVCHSATKDLESKIKSADLLISAMGAPDVVDPSWIKPGASVFDVSINRHASGKMTGDIALDECKHVGRITPVPGGVGPMTVACLQFNTCLAAMRKENDEDLLAALALI